MSDEIKKENLRGSHLFSSTHLYCLIILERENVKVGW